MALIPPAAKMTTKLIQDQIALEKLQKFLQANNLPHADIRLNQNLFIGYYDDHDNLIASGGLECYGNAALLRSVAVAESLRGKSLGTQIVDDLINKAKTLHIEELYLLTETAHNFFVKKGFKTASRKAVPELITQSPEFSHLCPSTAHCMVYKIG